MKKLTALLLFFCIMSLPTGTTEALVFYSLSSSALFNSDGISSGSSVISSPLGGEISFKEYSLPSAGFGGAVFCHDTLYLVPHDNNELVTVHKGGETTAFPLPDIAKTNASFLGGATDGTNIYLSPYNAVAPLIINTETNQFTVAEDFVKSSKNFCGAIFDGEYTWFLPASGKDVACMDSLGVTKSYEIPYDIPETNAFSGGVFAKEKIYFVPDNASGIITLNVTNGEFSRIEELNTVTGCSGGIFDGDSIYLIPHESASLYKISQSDNSAEKIPLPKIENARYSGGAFDGRNIWMSPYSGGTVLKFDIYSGEFTGYELPDTSVEYRSGAFDGTNVWLAPATGSTLLRISGNNNPPTAMNLFLEVETGESVTGELTAQDENSGDSISFRTESEPFLGTLIYDAITGNFTYTAGTLPGKDEFYYTAYDGYDRSNKAKVTITVRQKAEQTGGLYIDLWNHWAESAALDLTEQGVLTGENVDNYYYFYPDSIMTRGQFCVMANSSFGFDGSINDNTLPFADTSDSPAWVRLAASAAYHGNMVQGKPSENGLLFDYNEALTRIEAISMIYNVVRPTAKKNIVYEYSDRGVFPVWATEIINAMTDCGLLRGYEDNTVRPYNKVSRAEAAVMLSEALRFYDTLGTRDEALK